LRRAGRFLGRTGFLRNELGLRNIVKEHRPGEIIALGKPDTRCTLEINQFIDGLHAFDDDRHVEGLGE